ncbi:hypothetical protein BUB20358_06796 [Burkholderia ubonensis]|nr:hypothetical protein BUB20358_06796 [Burkholderia ubonensis]
MRDAERELDQAGHARAGLGVADLGLDRADHERRVVAAPLAVDGLDRVHLDRVAERRAGAVRLHVADARGVELRGAQRVAHQRDLRGRVRRGQPLAAAVVIDGRADDRGQDRVAVGQRARQPLEHHHRAAFAAHVAVGAVIEGPALPGGRQHARVRADDRRFRRQDQRGAARERQFAFVVEQAAAGEMHGDQRRRAGRVDRHARPVHAENVGEPPRRDAERLAGRVVRRMPRVGAGDVGRVQVQVVLVHHADEHAHPAPVERRARVAAALDRLPRDLEQQPLLRVHRLGLARRDREEIGVEAVDLVDQAERARMDAPARLRVRVVVRGHVPALGRHLADAAARRAQQRPVVVGAGDAARQPATDADDRDRLGGGAVVDLLLLELERERHQLVLRQPGQPAQVFVLPAGGRRGLIHG